jgi:phosphoribosylaminoimidazole-succinocarboxamide synthase
MGSVKDVVVIEAPQGEKSGIGKFVFSDRFSVFDWGKMPDTIPNKGKAICIMGAFFFESLEKENIKTHYMGVVDGGKITRLSDTKNPPGEMIVKLVRVLKPELKDGKYDYSIYKKERVNFLIPLEVIYRNSLPEGSSIFKRLKEGKIKPQDLGLEEYPRPGQKLPKTIVDISTKLESTDRYISWDEAMEIAGLSESEADRIKEMTIFASSMITSQTEKKRISNEDGKFEFAFDERRNIMFVDVLGTPDECRFILDGFHISKEVLRKFYRKTSWYVEIEEAKKKDQVMWRNFVKSSPPRLPDDIMKLVSQLYMSCCNEVTEREWFKSPPLSDVIRSLRSFLD